MAALARFIQFPELIRTVYQLSDRSEQLDLLRVTRSFFVVGISIIWEKIEGVHNILVLIPDAHCIGREGEPKAKTISLPANPVDLRRFDLYAPFVKNLEIYDRETEKFWIPNWRGFMSHARDRTLLPNLETLTLTTTSSHSNQLMWIRAFLSPSLINIEVTPSARYVPLISHLSASTLLKHIGVACPKIQLLSLFPNSRTTSEADLDAHDEQAMINFWDTSLADYLKRLPLLRELASTTEILSPNCVVQLASLPHLTRLAIYPLATPFTVIQLASPTRFTALRHFELCMATPTQFYDTWRLGIFENLTSIELSFITQPDSDEFDHRTWATSIMALIAVNSPQLSDLIIDFDLHIAEKKLYNLGSVSVLSPLKTLPLKELHLREATLGVHTPATSFQDLKDFLPNVVILELPNQICTLKELYEFARLPNLKRLVVDLSLRTPDPQDPIPHPVNSNSNFRILESNYGVDVVGDIHAMARRLLSMWPGLRLVKWSAETERESDIEPSAAATISTALNSTISLLRDITSLVAVLRP
ncbi:hypothetical protein BDV93DRAFT_526902 [Ceratobasidium sp. AG-I]|nr:hypothetical protein BDV93DRAFT_526902 [Ceratobasidium sp. AG-I]